MKKYLSITVISLLILSCKAQNIVPIYNKPDDLPPLPRYYKDVDNDFNKLEGMWKWQEGNTSLTIELKKMTKIPVGLAFRDLLVGEYQYSTNGIECTNTLPLTPKTTISELLTHNITGWNITTINRGAPPCPECAPNTRFIRLGVKDPIKPGLYGDFVLAHFIENGVEKLRLRFLNTYNENSTLDYTGPEYLCIPENAILTLIKQ